MCRTSHIYVLGYPLICWIKDPDQLRTANNFQGQKRGKIITQPGRTPWALFISVIIVEPEYALALQELVPEQRVVTGLRLQVPKNGIRECKSQMPF